MSTNTTQVPDADLIPATFHVASDLADHRLSWGKDGEVWGDYIEASNLLTIIIDMRDEAGFEKCEYCESNLEELFFHTTACWEDADGGLDYDGISVCDGCMEAPYEWSR